MKQNYGLVDGKLQVLENGVFSFLKRPTKAEIGVFSKKFDFPFDYIGGILDDYENARFEVDKNGTILLLLQFPAPSDVSEIETYPYSLILTADGHVIFSLNHEIALARLTESKFDEKKVTHQLIFRVIELLTAEFQTYLHEFRETRHAVAKSIEKSTKNDQLLQLIRIQSSLVYFQDALTNNLGVLTEFSEYLKENGQDGFSERIEDLIVETDQAQTDSRIQEKLLENLRDLFSNIVANNLNIVMKIMTSATFVLGIPAVIVGFYGMNVPIPNQTDKNMIWIIIFVILTLSGLVSWWLKKRDMM
ncbi:MAG: magnesium transporter CorA family protein [Streptococcaceae bacterium]|jgi:magnesium transporter|nr:magnesium transporter CorA family protein [Streptococcaceae bacterium]